MTSPSSSVPNLDDDAFHQPSIRLTDQTLFPAASANNNSKMKGLASSKMDTFISRGTSLMLFRKWLIKDSSKIDASDVVSKACFDDWCLGRPNLSSEGLCRTFQRVLKAHITGSEGREPFHNDEEAAILKVIRKKQIWPAFTGTKLTIGCRGFRGYGFHERQQTLNSSSNESPLPQQQLVARYVEDPTISKRNRKARAKRGAAEMALPQNKVFKQAEIEYPSTPQQFWMLVPSTLPTANIYSQPYNLMLQSHLAYSPLLGMHNKPLLVPNGFFNPMTFHVLSEQTIVRGRSAFDNDQPNG